MGKGAMHRFVVSIIALMGIAAAPAWANDRSICDGKSTPEERIAACTRLISKGRMSNASITYGNRGMGYQAKGEQDRAIEDFTESIRLSPKASFPYWRRGRSYINKREHDRAIKDLSEAIRLEPGKSIYYNDRAVAHGGNGDRLSAIADYDEAIRIEPKDANYRNRDFEYCEKGDYARAIADYDEAIRRGPREAINFRGRASCYRKMGEHERALADNEEAIRLDPKAASSYVGRGLAHLADGDIDRAIADYDEAIRINPKFGAAYKNRGLALEKKGDLHRAISDFRMAVSLITVPNSPVAKEVSEAIRRIEGALAADAAAAKVVAARPMAPAPAAAPTVAGSPGRRVALVIGNSSYRSVAALSNPRHDASRVAEVLRQIGFDVVKVDNDLTREKFVAALRGFADEADRADWAVIYYAGHGIELSGHNYLLPVDARLRTDRDVQDEAIALDRVLSAVEGAKKLRLIVLDACRDNPFASQMRRTVAARSIGRGFARVEPETGTLVVYAAKHGEIALDGEGGNSPFVSALIDRIRTPGLEVRRLFDLVRDDVMAATNRRQQPFSYGSGSGNEDFFFLAR
jgi:tetratricopeptide (TPR) repeat protein